MAPLPLNLTPIARGILADLQAGQLTSPSIIAKYNINAKTFYKWRARFKVAGFPFQTPRTPATLTPAQHRRLAKKLRRIRRRYWRQVRAGKRPKPRIGNVHFGERPGEGEVVQLILELRRRPMTTPAIVAELIRRRIPTRRGGMWGVGIVQRILSRHGGPLARRMFTAGRKSRRLSVGSEATAPAPKHGQRPAQHKAKATQPSWGPQS